MNSSKKKPSRPVMKNTKKLSKNEACNVRALAAEILLKMQQGQSLSALLPEYQNRVPAKDFPLLQEITFGVARVLPRLEKILTYLLDKPLKGKTRIVQCLLLVGLYQILYTRVPEFAAVDEVVNATKSLKVDNMRALVNAVLRRFLREKEEILTKADKHWHTMHPDWFINLLKPVYPNWREIIEANNQKPPMWLRVNAKIARDDYRQALQANGIETATDLHPQALRLLEACGVQKLPNFDEGDVTVQDVHAQWAARLLEPQNGELILDACAAPGGKTTHILELAPEAQVVALDVEENRLKRVRENLARLKQSAEIICADASNPQAWWKNKPQFDKILLDAPCSATGVIRRHPDIKWLRQPEDIPQLVALQYKILEAMWGLLKDNGTLLYATCSVLAQENRQQIERFLKAHPDAELVILPFEGQTAESVGQQFLPQANGGDGFFYAKLKKQSKESK